MLLSSKRGTYMKLDLSKFIWTREPDDYKTLDDRIEIITEPHTDLWQRTYYHFRNDNAPLFQAETNERYFSFTRCKSSKSFA